MTSQHSDLVTILLGDDLRNQVTAAAARRRQSVEAFCLSAIRERLVDDSGATANLTELTALADPVLADLWDNAHDAAYDSLPAR